MVRRVSIQHSIIGVSALVAAVGVGYCLNLPRGSETKSAQAYPVEHYEPVEEFAPLPVILPQEEQGPLDELALTSARPPEAKPRWYEASEPRPQLEAFPPMVDDDEPQERTAFLPASTDRTTNREDSGDVDLSPESPADKVCEYNDFPNASGNERKTVSVLMNDPTSGSDFGPEISEFRGESDHLNIPAREEPDFGSPTENFADVAPAPDWVASEPPLASEFSPPQQTKFDLPPPVAGPVDLQQIEIRARRLIEEGVERYDRRMLASAKLRFVRALRVVSQSLDAQTQDNQHSVALSEGIRAMKEAEDFSPDGSRLEGDVNVAMKAASHRTPVLKEAGESIHQATPMAAIQAYYQFAQQRLADACGKQPIASQALFAWGKVEAAEKLQNSGHALSETKAMALYQAALMVDSKNQRAANELGVALARFGKLASARDVLRHSVATAPSPESWQNLSEVHARLGEQEMAKLARQEMVLLANATSTPTPQNTSVQWLTPEQFAGGRQMTASAPPAAEPEPVYQAAPWWMPWRR